MPLNSKPDSSDCSYRQFCSVNIRQTYTLQTKKIKTGLYYSVGLSAQPNLVISASTL
ncbi:hypothetical protein J3D56_002988 [Erwinia persicina]|nr:hypothetical protein [Erwinia persicina]